MKEKINKILSKTIGYHLSKSNKSGVVELFESKWMKSFNLKTILDVGANTGQFAKQVRKAMPHVNIISFEPIPDEYKKLKDSFKEDANFKAYKLAISDIEEIAEFELNDFSPTSSLLEFSDKSDEYHPLIGESKTIKVEVKRLDQLEEIKALEPNVLLKIDVQGLEDKVILGSHAILSKVKVIYVECSYIEVYKNQPLFEDIYKLLNDKGFLFRGIADQLNGGRNFEPIQIDAIFVNNNN